MAELRWRLNELAGTLATVGGEFVVRADRVKLGELPGAPRQCQRCTGTGEVDYDQGDGLEECRSCGGAGEKPGKPELIGETVGFLITWRDVPQLREESLTANLMDHVLGPEEGEEARSTPEQAAAELAAAMTSDPEPGDPDDDEEQE
jgi:hypothetical protein